jgi:predicted Zn-dependent peptidase
MELFNDSNANGFLYATPDHVIGELSFPKEHIDDVVSIAAEVLTSPRFDTTWTNRVKQGLIANQSQAQAAMSQQMWQAARLAILSDTPLYNFLSLSDVTVIEDVTVDDLLRWHQSTIVKSNVTIVVTGAISRADAGKAVEQLLADLPAAEPIPASPIKPDFTPRTILLHLPEAEKTTLGLVGQLPPTSEGGDLIDLLALNFFARSGDGPLFNAVRTELRASYGFEAGFTNYDRATRLMFIGGEVETEKLSEAANLILTTYDNYRTDADLTGFDDLRRGISDHTEQNVLFVDVAARTILQLALDQQDTSIAPRLGAEIDAVLAKDVSERLSTVYPTTDRMVIVAASPDANALPDACVITQIEQVVQCP